MSANDVRLFVRRWWFIGGLLFGLGKWVADLQGSVDAKADKDDVSAMRDDIREIKQAAEELKEQVGQLGERQQEFYCDNKPKWCR